MESYCPKARTLHLIFLLKHHHWLLFPVQGKFLLHLNVIIVWSKLPFPNSSFIFVLLRPSASVRLVYTAAPRMLAHSAQGTCALSTHIPADSSPREQTSPTSTGDQGSLPSPKWPGCLGFLGTQAQAGIETLSSAHTPRPCFTEMLDMPDWKKLIRGTSEVSLLSSQKFGFQSQVGYPSMKWPQLSVYSEIKEIQVVFLTPPATEHPSPGTFRQNE